MLQWIHDNPVQAFALGWSAVGALADGAAKTLPAGKWQRLAQVIAHVSPGNVIAAYRVATGKQS